MYMQKSIDEIRSALDKKEVTSEELIKEALTLAHESQEKYNPFVTILDDAKHDIKSNSKLDGIPYALKDNFSTKGILTTASSNILKDYVPVYDATIYKKLKESGAVCIGKTVLDELAMGGTGTTGHTGVVKNPWDTNRLIGGSSAGSAASVASGVIPFAIGSDTGDSVRKPAAFGGIVGFKPTYGRLSRYGLFAFASSLDHVGIFARNVLDVAYVTDVMKGHDDRDMTSLPDTNEVYADMINNDIKGKKLFYIKEAVDLDNIEKLEDEELKESLRQFKTTIDKCRELGFIVEPASVDKNLLNALYPTYMSISCAEATSNNANLTGIIFGPRAASKSVDDVMFKARTIGFSELIKRRFIMGSFILQKENQEKLFLNAGRIRHMVVDRINELFKEYDGLIMPTSGGIAPKFGQKSDQLSDRYLILENHLVIGNFGGFPSISIPSGFINGMPISINITGRQFEDALTLNMAHKIEEALGYKNQIAKEGK